MTYALKGILNLFNDTKCINKIQQVNYDIGCEYGTTYSKCYTSFFKDIFNEILKINTCYNRSIYNNETSFNIKIIKENIEYFNIIFISVILLILLFILTYYFIKIEKCYKCKTYKNRISYIGYGSMKSSYSRI